MQWHAMLTTGSYQPMHLDDCTWRSMDGDGSNPVSGAELAENYDYGDESRWMTERIVIRCEICRLLTMMASGGGDTTLCEVFVPDSTSPEIWTGERPRHARTRPPY